jgi:hypothetical protein
MLTGIVLEPRKQRELRHLGAKEVSNIKDCTYLITAKIVRTEKMLSAIALCTHIISEQWIDESIKAGKLLGMSFSFKSSNVTNNRLAYCRSPRFFTD